MPTIENFLTAMRYIGYFVSAVYSMAVVTWLVCFIVEIVYPWPRWDDDDGNGDGDDDKPETVTHKQS